MYGIKSNSAEFIYYLPERRYKMRFKYCISDSNISMRPSVIPDDKEYCDYLIIYVDDILLISIDPDAAMNQLREQLKLKNYKMEEPSNYLGDILCKKIIYDM